MRVTIVERHISFGCNSAKISFRDKEESDSVYRSVRQSFIKQDWSLSNQALMDRGDSQLPLRDSTISTDLLTDRQVH